jgi:hypothetical protein
LERLLVVKVLPRIIDVGYGTAIYGVDLHRLRAAVGSQDPDLLGRMLAKWREQCVDTSEGPRIRITAAGEIFLDGRPVADEAELVEELLRPECIGQTIHWYVDRREKHWSSGYFIRGFAPKVKHKFSWFSGYSDEKDLLKGETEFLEKHAIAELIRGEYSRPDCAFQYGYALERLCQTIGRYLDTIEGSGRLKQLKLPTALCKTRLPVALPKFRSAPYISFLSADEVRSEVEQLVAGGVEYPGDPHLEEDRQAFLNCLQDAAKEGDGIVSFYH